MSVLSRANLLAVTKLLAIASVSALAPTATRRTVLASALSAPLIGRTPSASADVSTCLSNVENHKRAADCQESGLGIIDVEKGTGLQPRAGQTVVVQYNGWLDGFGESRLGEGESEKLFDSSYAREEEGFTFEVGTGKVIKGWDEAVLSMKVGGKRRIVVPPEMG
jgi:peptidylprolyl isomerase